MSKQKKYHYIYRTTCKITGKFYIGMHSTDSLEDGYLGSGKILGYSRKKYGDENHIKEVVEYCVSRDELKRREKEIVNEDLLKDPLNINLKYGGDGGGKFSSKEHQQKCSSAGGKKSWFKSIDKLNSAESIKKRAESLKKNGRIFTLGMLNKKHSEETKKKMSVSQSGKKNSQFGTCWVTNGLLSVKINKELLEQYINNGYVRGRKVKYASLAQW